jgi:hypothetical protein
MKDFVYYGEPLSPDPQLRLWAIIENEVGTAADFVRGKLTFKEEGGFWRASSALWHTECILTPGREVTIRTCSGHFLIVRSDNTVDLVHGAFSDWGRRSEHLLPKLAADLGAAGVITRVFDSLEELDDNPLEGLYVPLPGEFVYRSR